MYKLVSITCAAKTTHEITDKSQMLKPVLTAVILYKCMHIHKPELNFQPMIESTEFHNINAIQQCWNGIKPHQ